MGRPTNKKRKDYQQKVERYMKDREDLQLAGRIPTAAEGAVRDERVDPSVQGEQRLADIDRAAITKGWAVPEHAKAKVIERLLEPFYEEPVTVEDRDGNPVTLPIDRNLLKENAKVLVQADRYQYERDNPKAAGLAKGGVNVTQQVAVVDKFSWDEITGDVPDKAQMMLDQLDEEAEHERTVPDIRRGVPGGDEVGEPTTEERPQADEGGDQAAE